MPSCEEVKEKGAPISTLFKPRPILLSSSSSKPNTTTMKDKKSSLSLTCENRVTLYHSICHFLQLNGFLKTLKKFRRETNIQKDSWKNCTLNLEEICQEHLQNGSDANGKVPDARKNGADGGKNTESVLENNLVNGDNVKSNKKKKNTNSNDTSNNVNEANLKDDDSLSLPSGPVKESKDKKKKHKDELVPSDGVVEHQAKVAAGKVSEEDVSREKKSKSKKKKGDTSMHRDEVEKDKKGSKKRKKSSSEENTSNVEETPVDDFKCRKTDNSEQSNDAELAPKTPKADANGVLENNEGKKSEKLNKMKEHDDSTQPKTANAFRRVKADEVEFADEKLQDNSYWAKDGADSGYGAKAQEVLGQVRGRDFRHEKTKKKRGSYRGGQIDLQSHSVKFNYDDDE